ncbi:MAG: hypothetical protein HFJ33_00755 [Clostridia bacterium]|nr:hypothetical protein [Clostridia bacterium]
MLKKVYYYGDHKQIPPIPDNDVLHWCQQNEIDTNLYENSLFEYLYTNTIKKEASKEHVQLLDTQFRMPEEVADIISEWFYEGQYHSAEKKKNLQAISPKFERPFCLINTTKAVNKKEVKIKDSEGNFVPINSYEANIIANIVHDLLKNQIVEEEEIGVIVPYKMQLECIKKQIRKQCGRQVKYVDELVKTLDSYQGQERDVIIYGITRCNEISPENPRIGFLKELRRFNVALTRCKKQMIVVGDFEFLKQCKNQKEEKNETSEKKFGEFVTFMLERVKQGNGAMIESQEMLERLK